MTSKFYVPCPDPNSYRHFADQPPTYPGTENPQLPGSLPPASGYQPVPVGYNPSEPEIMLVPITSQPQPCSTAPALLQNNNECQNPNNSDAKDIRFSDLTVRRKFMRKVYTILLIQISIMLVIVGIIFTFNTKERFCPYILGEFLFLWVLVIWLLTLTFLGCCGESPRKHPINYIYLFIYTLAESFILASFTVCIGIEILITVGIIAGVYLGLTIFAFQTKYDYTSFRGRLFAVCLILLIFVLAVSFDRYSVRWLYMSLTALLYSILLVCETGEMLEGNHIFSLAPDDFVFAALILHISILNIVIYILSVPSKWLNLR